MAAAIPVGTLVLSDGFIPFVFLSEDGVVLTPPAAAPTGLGANPVFSGGKVALDSGRYIEVEAGNGLIIHGANFNVVATLADASTYGTPATDYVGAFYVLYDPTHTGTLTYIRKFSPTGVVLHTWNLGGTEYQFLAVSPDGNTAYIAESIYVDHVDSYDLAASTGPTLWVTGEDNGGGNATVGSGTAPCLIALRDGRVLVTWLGFPVPDYVTYYESDGTKIRRFAVAAAVGDLIFPISASADTTSFWAEWSADLSTAHFQKIRLSDGAILKSFDKTDPDLGLDWFNLAFTVMPVAIAAGGTVRPEPLLLNSQPCCGGTTAVGTKAGPVLPPTSTAWTRRSATSGTVPTQADITNAEDWTMTATPCFRFTLHLTNYPAALGTTTLRWSQRPYADANWSEGRLTTIGDIVRSCTDQDGNYELSRMRIEGSDDDSTIRALINASGTRFFYGRQCELEVLSEAGRLASLAWRVVFRGVVVGVQALPGHRFSLEAKDLIGSRFSGFDLDKTIGVPLGDEHVNLPDESRKKIYPIISGEHSDYPALDVNGVDARKALLPTIDTGDYDVSGEVSPAPPTYAAPPVITSSGVVGTVGQRTYYYGATVITPYGESGMSNVVAVSGASVRNAGNYNFIEGTYDNGGHSPYNAVRIWRGDTPDNMSAWLDEANYFLPEGSFGYADGAAPYPNITRDEYDEPKYSTPPASGVSALQSDTIWARLLVCIGAATVDDILWSDLADGVEPKRVVADPALEGVEWMTSSSPQWPHADPWLELANPTTGETIRGTYIYVRGRRLEAMRTGAVTIAVNAHMTDNVVQAFLAGQQFINEHILKDNGTGYRNGAYGTLETFANGDAQLWTSAWAAAQAVSVARIGGDGYLADFSIHVPITVREWIRRFCISFDCRIAVNQHGQIFPVLIDDLAVATAGRAYREFVDDVRLVDQTLANDEIENRIVYAYDFDADAGALRVVDQTIEDAASIAAHVPGGVVGNPNPRGVHQGVAQELLYCRDQATALDSRARRLTRNKEAPRYVVHAQDFRGLEDDLGAQTRFTHRDGKGATGDALTPLCVLRHTLRASHGSMETELLSIDIERLAVGDAATDMTAIAFVMTANGPEMR